MKDRKQEISVKWGVNGLKAGGILGTGLGALNYIDTRHHWNVHEQRYCHPKSPLYIPGYTISSYFRPRPADFVLPLAATIPIIGGLGYVAGKACEKIQFSPTKSTPSTPDRWANNGLKIGAVTGFGVSCLRNYINLDPILHQPVRLTITGGLFCAGVGLFGGKIAERLKGPADSDTFVPTL